MISFICLSKAPKKDIHMSNLYALHGGLFYTIRMNILHKIVLGFFALLLSVYAGVGVTTVQAQEVSEVPTVFLFGRDDCSFCKAEAAFLDEENIQWEYLNVVDDAISKDLFAQITAKHDLSKVTPITVVGGIVMQGFNGPDTTGARIVAAIEEESGTPYITIADHIANAPISDVLAGKGCDEDGIECDIGISSYVFDLPFVGIVDLKTFSLLTLSIMLGVIDGFNPCAMWVLVTFLVLLTQAGSRKKMVALAGMFIVAEAVMYYFILNVWYKTWDFVALDQVVTPLVGILALGGGVFFLYRWYKHRNVALVCDISSIDQQSRTIDRFKKIINEPLTLGTIAAVLVIAFSVNIIEFACSIGIPQAFTKILELNMLSFVEQQFYILVYTAGYMVDDFVVFGLAIWGFSRLEAHGHKYAQLSLLVGGVLMLLLGAILVFSPTLLVL